MNYPDSGTTLACTARVPGIVSRVLAEENPSLADVYAACSESIVVWIAANNSGHTGTKIKMGYCDVEIADLPESRHNPRGEGATPTEAVHNFLRCIWEQIAEADAYTNFGIEPKAVG